MPLLLGVVVVVLAGAGLAITHQLTKKAHAAGSNLSNYSHITAPGFDVCGYPSTSVMQTWWNSSPYRWVNIYIGGINRSCKTPPPASWVTTAYNMGWSFVPTYVGLQAPAQCVNAADGFASMSLDTNTAFAQGKSDADDAVTTTEAAGINPGAVIYDDMEHWYDPQTPGPCDQAVIAYTNGWDQELHSRGFHAGMYMAGDNLYILPPSGIVQPDDMWITAGGFVTSNGGYDGACTVYGNHWFSDSVWHGHRLYQYPVSGGAALGHGETWGGVTISSMDSDCADGYVVGHTSAIRHMPGYSQFGSDRYQLHSDGSIWIYQGTPITGWQELDKNPATIAIATDGNGHLYQLHNDGTIWVYNGPPITGWQMLDKNPATIAIAVDGLNHLYQLHNDGTIWVYQGTPITGWLELDKNPQTIALATDGLGHLYQLHNDGSIWIYQGPPITGWLELDKNPQTVAIAADGKGDLFQLHNDGTIWIYQGTPITGWLKLDQNPQTIAIAADNIGHLYQLHNDGTIWIYQGTPITGWLKLDQNPATVAIAADGSGNLYQLHNDGTIWLYQGTPITGWLKIDKNPATVGLSGAY